jgi:hypothetical protein
MDYSSSIYHSTLPNFRNHLLSSLLHFKTPTNTIPQQGIHTRRYSNPDLAGSPEPQCGDYKAIIGLSVLWVPYFRARRGASMKVIQSDTTSAIITKCFLITR